MPVTESSLKLASLLNRRPRGVTLAEAARVLGRSEGSVRRIRREVETLFNVNIRHDRRLGTYRLDPGTRIELSGIWLDAGEMAALLGLTGWLETLGAGVLREHLDPLRARLDELLANRNISPRDWTDRIRLLPMHFRPVDPGVLMAAAEAVLGRRRLKMEHRGFGETAFQPRSVSPQRLVHYRNNWYLDAWDHGARGLRCFALSRARNLRVQPREAKDVPGPRLDAHFGESYGIFAGRARDRAVLLFEGEAARIVREETWHPRQRASDLPDGRLRLEFPSGDLRELARDVLRFADEVTVERPPELREAVRDRLRMAMERS